MGEKRTAYRLLVGKPEGKTIRKTKTGGVDWIGLAQVRYRLRAPMNAVMNFQVP
jgi:hypothetical protein